jgi:hypothetical protein
MCGLDCQKCRNSLQLVVVAMRSVYRCQISQDSGEKSTMTSKADFIADEWERLLEAPVIAGMYISMSSPSLMGSIGESMSIAKTIAASLQQAAGNELLTALLADYQNKETAQLAKPHFDTKDSVQLKQEMTSRLQIAVDLLAQKAAPDEAQGIRQWLYQVAVNAATATKEGGFLSIGAVRVSDAEKAALVELAGIFGVEPTMPVE